MQIRVTLAAQGELPAGLARIINDLPGRRCVRDEAWGRAVTVFAEHDAPTALRDELRQAAGDVAVGVIAGPLATQPARLVLMDVDSTLTTTEAIDLLAAHVGVGAQVADITERAMRGELDFAESLRERVATLKGLSTAVFDEVGPAMALSPGAEEFVAAARQAGAKIGVTSGGFTQLVAPLAERLGLDFYNANVLEVADGRLTGRVTGGVVDANQKALDLRRFAEAHGINPAVAVAVGDGANDIGMFAEAGLSVAYRAKPVTAERADVAIGFPRLDAAAAFAFVADPAASCHEARLD